MLHDYINRYLLQKNRGVYFKKGKWVFHILSVLSFWVVIVIRLSKLDTAGGISLQRVAAGIIILAPFIAFFYFYCLYLIPRCFKRNEYARFWIILVALLLILPWINIGLRLLSEPYISLLQVYRQQASFGRYVLQEYGDILYYFTGFTSMLFLMELLESIRTSKEIHSNARQLAATELHMARTNMNSEVMYRSLDGIISLLRRNSKDAPDAIIHFSDVLRYRLYESGNSKAPLEKELEQLHNLFLLHNRIDSGYPQATLEIEGNAGDKYIIPLTLIHIAEPLFTTYKEHTEWSMIYYILIEEEQLEIAVELTSGEDRMAEKLEAIRIQLNMLWRTELIFTVEKDLYNYSVRICIPILTRSVA